MNECSHLVEVFGNDLEGDVPVGVVVELGHEGLGDAAFSAQVEAVLLRVLARRS